MNTPQPLPVERIELPKRIDFGNGWYGKLGAHYAKDYYVIFGPSPHGELDGGMRMFLEKCATPAFEAFAAAMQPRDAQHKASWLPIETAPKDGTEFVANTWFESIEDFDGAFVCRWHADWTDKGFVNVHDMVRGIRNPTHWMPLPTPPITNEGE